MLIRFGVPAKSLQLFVSSTKECALSCLRMTANTRNGLISRRSATRLLDVAGAVQRVLRCCDTRRSVTLQRGRKRRKGFGSPRGGCSGRKRGVIGMRWKGSMLLVHNAGITSKSFEGLDIMMTVIVTVFEAAGQTYRRRRRRRCCYEHRTRHLWFHRPSSNQVAEVYPDDPAHVYIHTSVYTYIYGWNYPRRR